jgi:hypothetical protein
MLHLGPIFVFFTSDAAGRTEETFNYRTPIKRICNQCTGESIEYASFVYNQSGVIKS